MRPTTDRQVLGKVEFTVQRNLYKKLKVKSFMDKYLTMESMTFKAAPDMTEDEMKEFVANQGDFMRRTSLSSNTFVIHGLY